MIRAVGSPADDEVMTVKSLDQPDQVAGIALAVGVDTGHPIRGGGSETVDDRARINLAQRGGDQGDRERRSQRLNDGSRAVG
jgi:hypothetical protein